MTAMLLGGAVLLAGGAQRARAQAPDTGTILGTVTDPSGAVVPNATVTAAEPDKGINRTVMSSKSGDFTVPSLPVGTYILTVTAGGFETFVADSITVDADRSVKLVAKLTVGAKGETVSVNAGGALLDTNSATLATTIPNNLVEDLPIDGRNVVALAALLPGVTDLNAPATNTGDRNGPTYSVSGGRNTQNLMLFDGLMWNNLFFNTGINFPPPNALQEISVLLNNFKAQYGRNASSIFNVTTKSGSNEIHGAVWDYVQSRIFNASDYITKENPTDNSNQAGFTLEGPIKKDKLFYAITFQDLIQHLQVIGITPTQSAAERGLNANGTPRLCVTPAYGAGATCASFLQDVTPTTPGATYGKFYNSEIYSSTSGDQEQPSNAISMFNAASLQAGGPANSPCNALLTQAATYAAANPYFNDGLQPNYLPNAEVPTQCLNPVILNFLNTYVPVPNSVSLNGLDENISKAGQPRNDKNATIRMDFIPNPHHEVYALYNLIDSDDVTAAGVTSASLGVATFGQQANHAVSNFGNIGDTWQVSQNVVNVARAGYKRYAVSTPPLDHNTWNSFGGNFVEPGSPQTVPDLDFSDEYSLGSTSQGNSSVVNENIELLEQLQWTHGNHSFQFGANFLRLQYLNVTDYPGKLEFSTTFTGYPDADGMLGLVTSVNANSPLVQGGIQHSIFGYAQDDWRVTSRLTLNLGTRYELPFQWFQPNGYASTFIPGHQSTVFPGAIGGLAFPGDQGVLRSLVPTDFNGLVPRFGAAYDVFGDGRLALRAGFGMFFDAINADVIGVGEPFYYQFYKQLPPGGASVPLAQYGSNPSDTAANGNVLQVPAGYNKADPQFIAPYSLFYPDRNFRTPYYEEMNIGFELRVTRGGVLDTNYVGKFGRKLTIPFDQNPAIAECSGGYYNANPELYGTPYCSLTTPGDTLNGQASSATPSEAARLRYTPFNYGGSGLVDFASIGTSNYNGLQVQYTQRHGRLLTLLMSYTYAKSIDLQTQSQSTTNAIPDVFDISSERGVSDYNEKHILNMGWLLNFPVVTEGPAITRSILNNWSFGGIFLAHSGRPYDVTINNDTALDDEPNQRAAILPGMNPRLPSNRHRAAKVQEWFNVDAFTYPTVGTFSNQQRNDFVGPAYLLTDFSLQRYFPLTRVREGMRLLFKADAFNVFNTPNLANPYADFSCTTTSIADPGNPNYGLGCTNPSLNDGAGSLNNQFGVVESTYGNNANTSTNGRKMQFSATVYF